MKRVAITGAGGSIGSSLAKFLIQDGSLTVCAFDNCEDALFRLGRSISSEYHQRLRLFLGDIRDQNRLISAFHGVDTVFHCAAVKHVGLNEYNPSEAVKTNILGTENIIEAVIANSVECLIYTSSDKAVNPTNTMGASKLLGEKLCIAANNLIGNRNIRISCVRFGNVLNTNGSVAKIFKYQHEQGKPLTVTDPQMSRFYITMADALQLCLSASRESVGGEIFIRNMGSARVIDIARAITSTENPTLIISGRVSGEKDYEELLTEVESSRAVAYGDLIVVVPELSHMPDYKISQLSAKYSNLPPFKSPLRSDQEHLPVSILQSMIQS